MDFIWVPGAPTSQPESNGMSVANELVLFICGFGVVAGCAVLATLISNGTVDAATAFVGSVWLRNLVPSIIGTFAWIGYLLLTAGSLIGFSKSKFSIMGKTTWVFATQSFALWLMSVSVQGLQ